MNAKQKLMHLVLLAAQRLENGFEIGSEDVTPENINEIYDRMVEGDYHWDALEDVRNSGIETGSDSGFSRHYESHDVATKYIDGTWVGWVFYYGGGKHGEPEGVPWMEKAKELQCKEEEVTVIKRTFSEM